MWERVGNSGDPAALRAFLDRYPNSIYAATAAIRRDALQGPRTQAAAGPAASVAAAPRNVGMDGIWRGWYRCGASAKAGKGPISAMDRMFVVKQGRLSGKWEGQNRWTETYEGTISPDGKVSISGSGEDRRMSGTYSMSFEGKAADGRFNAKGRHYDRQCELSYWKLD